MKFDVYDAPDVILLSEVLYHFQMGYLANSLVVLLAMLKFTDVVLPPYTPSVRFDSQIRSGVLVMSSKTLRCSGLLFLDAMT